MAAPTATAERCAGSSTTAHWSGKRKPAGACPRPVAFVVEDGSTRTLACTAHLGGLVARASERPARGQTHVSVWTIARWRAELEA